GGGQPAWRRGVRGRLARGRHEGGQAAGLRRPVRLRRTVDRGRHHDVRPTGGTRAVQRRAAGRCRDDPAAGPVGGRPADGRRTGHVAVPLVHHRLGLDLRVRHAGRPERVRRAARVFAAAQPGRGHAISADPGDHRGPRRPGRTGTLVQVLGRTAALPGGCGSGHPAGGHQGRTRPGQADPRAGRRIRRPVGIRRRTHRAGAGRVSQTRATAASVGLRSDRGPVLASLMLATSLVALDSTIIATAVPSVVADLSGFDQFPWLFSAYLLAQAVTVPVYAKLADTFGRKPIMYVGIGLFLAGSVLCGFAWSMTALIVFRALQGLGAGAVQPMAITIAGDIYTVAERAKAQGY